jgi:hypothetical protein
MWKTLFAVRPGNRFTVYLLSLFAFTAAFTFNLSGQQNEAAGNPESMQALQQRIEQLEAEVRSLRALETEVSGLRAQLQTLTAAGQPGLLVRENNAAATQEQASAAQESMPMHPEELNMPRLQIRGYADVGWSGSDQKGSTNSFALGQYNLFITSRLTDRASFLAETVLEADSKNQFGIDPQRLLLIYTVNDALNFSFGRYHTGIGFYNTAYHHSAFMQTTLGRPFLFQFEDGGGILPIHNVGVSVTGVLSNAVGLHYLAEIGNGRSARTALGVSPVENAVAEHNGKAFDLGLYFRPPIVTGLQLGASGYHDHLTPVVLVGGVPTRIPNVSEDIIAAHIVYQGPRFEFLNEGVLMRHQSDGSPVTVNIPGFYSQISNRWGRYRPYFRYEYLQVPVNDPLYADVGLIHGPHGGLRFDLSEMAAFKVEYGRNLSRTPKAVNTLGMQFSFAF